MQVDDYMAPTTQETPSIDEVKTTKKRKRATHSEPDLETLRGKARLYCRCPEQWRSVSRYTHKRLREWVEEQEYSQQRELQDSIFGFAHKAWGLALDKLLQADGKVAEEINNDLTLAAAIQAEGSSFVQFLTNRWRIAALSFVDAFNGKRKEITSREPTDTEQETNERDETIVVMDQLDHMDHQGEEEQAREYEEEEANNMQGQAIAMAESNP